MVNYCWNYNPSKLLLHFAEYRLDQLNSKHTKIEINSTIQYFEGYSRKKCLLKVWGFLIYPPQNGGQPCKTFTKLTRNQLLMANIFKLHQYKIFGLMKIHNMCKIWFANNIFSLLRWNKKYFSWVFKGFYLPENKTASLIILAIKREFLCNFAKKFRLHRFSVTINSKLSKLPRQFFKRYVKYFFKFCFSITF